MDVRELELLKPASLLKTGEQLCYFLKKVRHLAPLNHLQNLKSSIPETVTFMEMYGAETFEDLGVVSRWEKHAPYKSLAVPLGLRGKEDIVYLNLHEKAHGPHGLVAGTTGSGKSEVIQSYILSLAVNFHPHDVAFLLIDYKGGGMANLFKDLPHLLGTITNLDGAQSMRALVSINAELKRHQRLFATHDVNHINQYQKKYKLGEVSEPMPHLFLISDEFAELKTNQPDFMKELVSTAAKDSNVDDFFWKVMTKLDDMEDIPKVFSEFVTSNGAITNVLSKLPVDKQDDIINALVRTSERSGQVFNTVMTWVNKAGNISEWITKIAGSKPAQILGKVADSGLGKVISSPWLMPVANGTISGFSSYFDSTDKAHKDVGKAVAGGIIDGIASIGPIDGALIGAKFGPWGAIAGLSFGAISQTLQFIYPDGVDKIKDGVYDLIDNTREIGKT